MAEDEAFNAKWSMITACLVSLAASNIPPDIQDLLVNGNPDRDIPPDALWNMIGALAACTKVLKQKREAPDAS